MPPKLLRDVVPPVRNFMWGPVLVNRPQLSSFVMQVICLWSAADALINGMLAELLKLDILVATKMLQSVDNSALRRQLIRVAAEHALPPADFQLYVAALKTTKE